MSFKSDFEKNGFVVVKNVFTFDEIAQYRKSLVEIFSDPPLFEGDRNNIRFDPLLRYPELRSITGKSELVQVLEEILGKEFVLLPEVSIHDSGLQGGWHRDTGYQEFRGQFFHREPGYQIVNVAVYFQDNHEKYGGGLDIVPGSHKTNSSWWQKQKSSNRKLKFLLSQLDKRHLLPHWILHHRKGQYTIPSKAGDVVIFHTHCEHRPTHPKLMPIPSQHRKLALFLLFSSNNKHASNYVNFIRERSDYVYLKNYQYPTEYKALAESQGVKLYEI